MLAEEKGTSFPRCAKELAIAIPAIIPLSNVPDRGPCVDN